MTGFPSVVGSGIVGRCSVGLVGMGGQRASVARTRTLVTGVRGVKQQCHGSSRQAHSSTRRGAPKNSSLSTSNQPSGDAAGVAWYRTTLAKNGLIVGGLVGAATYIAYNFTGFIMSFNSRYWVYLGFLGGATFALLISGAVTYVGRNITILPENVFRQAVRVGRLSAVCVFRS